MRPDVPVQVNINMEGSARRYQKADTIGEARGKAKTAMVVGLSAMVTDFPVDRMVDGLVSQLGTVRTDCSEI